MNLTLKRLESKSSGIFGEIQTERGPFVATLEHAYPKKIVHIAEGGERYFVDGWGPKLPAGTYLCKRGEHQLHSGPIETFEVTGVPGHSGILIHPGNTEGDSEGCILLGMARSGDSIIQSKVAFRQLMDLLAGQDEFTLTVGA